MPKWPVHARIDGPIVLIGFGSIGKGTLPLIERHFSYDKKRFVVIDPEDKDRKLVAIVAPSGKTFDAGFGPDAYNSLGKTAEWRVRNRKPIALIIRIDERNESGGNVTHSGLAVSKITRSTACVVATVDSSKNWRDQARKLADSSASKPCLPYMGFWKISKPLF